MSPRERILTALYRQQPDRVPYTISAFSPGIDSFNRKAALLFKERTDFYDTNKYFGIEEHTGWVGFKSTKLDSKERFLKYHHLPENSIFLPWQIFYGRGFVEWSLKHHNHFPENSSFIAEWGVVFVIGSDIAYSQLIPPKPGKSVKAIEEYPFPDFISDYRHNHLEEEVKKIKEDNLASIGAMPCTIFERAWQVNGFNEVLIGFLNNEEWIKVFLDKITELRVFQARRFAEAGVDIIHIGDDVGMENQMMMRPELWREWLKPRLAKIIKAGKKVNPSVIFFYHSDGYIEPIIPDFIEIGVDVLNPVQPECMDPAKLKRKYGDRLAFWGTFSIQKTLPFGTPEEVKAEVKERIETVGKGGGLYLTPTHVVAPEVPYENLFAFVEAAKKYGKYR